MRLQKLPGTALTVFFISYGKPFIFVTEMAWTSGNSAGRLRQEPEVSPCK
jgi:hypothetical protein